MKEYLPKVFVSPITKKIDNDQEIFMGSSNKSDKSVSEVLDTLFTSDSYTFRRKFKITTKNEVLTTSIISRQGNKLLTLDNRYIDILDIISIEELSSR